MQGFRPSSFPTERNLKLDKCEDSPRVNASQYIRLIGRLFYLQVTRPDVAYSFHILSQCISDPRQRQTQLIDFYTT